MYKETNLSLENCDSVLDTLNVIDSIVSSYLLLDKDINLSEFLTHVRNLRGMYCTLIINKK